MGIPRFVTHSVPLGGPSKGIFMHIANWYKRILIAWALLAIPIILLTVGFAGGNPFSGLDFNQFTWLDLTLWIGGWVMLLAPIWLVPFALKRRG